jgi:fermentation-respiration switch protein FrsA (DUF1100 family)
VHGGRIAGLGLSVAGELLLQTAAHDARLRAVVSEGAGSRSLREELQRPGGASALGLSLPITAGIDLATSVFGHSTPPTDLRHLVGHIAPRPVFLIYAGHGVDSEDLNPSFYRAAGAPKLLWRIPESGHTEGIETRPREYERRVVGFLDRALAPEPRS